MSTASSGSGFGSHDDATSSQYATSTRSREAYARTAPIYPAHLYGSEPDDSRRGSTASFVGQFAGLEFDSGTQIQAAPREISVKLNGDGSSVTGTSVGATDESADVHVGFRPAANLTHGRTSDQAPYPQMRSSPYPSMSQLGEGSNSLIGGSLQPFTSHPPIGSPFNPSYALEAPSYQGSSNDVSVAAGTVSFQANPLSRASVNSPAVDLHQSVTMSSVALPEAYSPLFYDAPRTMRDQIMQGPVRRAVSAKQHFESLLHER